MQITIDSSMIEETLKQIVYPTFMRNASINDLIRKAIEQIIVEKAKEQLMKDQRFMIELKLAIEQHVKSGFEKFGEVLAEGIADSIISRLDESRGAS